MPLIVPADLSFADLALELAPDGGLRYRPAPLRTIAVLNARPCDTDDDAMALIAAWYLQHREAGGEPDSVCETFVAMLNAGL